MADLRNDDVILTPSQNEKLFKLAIQQTIALNLKLSDSEKDQGYRDGLAFAVKLFDAIFNSKET